MSNSGQPPRPAEKWRIVEQIIETAAWCWDLGPNSPSVFPFVVICKELGDREGK